MRLTGIVLLILGIVLAGLSTLLLGNNDINAILGALLLGMGGASIIASLTYLFR
ncbi:Uncharacterised protein [Corynebacterium kutscheri]|uniref:Uncharacterized protein n=1 Tax=Corynebacterium kutscheri TaxID=35755 RepID=A0A0F6R0V0_9CORY|nr:hypothetical protein [Corynebacterium kutscheri]AKE40663.1 hypothetical protein UL82_02190 [Corynebacterium kutscheri]VEH04753.1 Uncharacterised protein [Corynebacterium kutscheri]VEH11060.1 Uncharacterised protein [Corynebacterium kutscheri]VEH80462.1 Uncharacterised protein [Corynebacterium kutscheri]